MREKIANEKRIDFIKNIGKIRVKAHKVVFLFFIRSDIMTNVLFERKTYIIKDDRLSFAKDFLLHAYHGF